MKKIFKKKIKFIFGLIIGIIISGVGVYASTMFAANQVSYDNSNVAIQKNDVNVTNVQDAIEVLYDKALVCENGGSGSNTGCPGEGCYYTWDGGLTTWYKYGEPNIINPSNLPSGVSTNYNDVVQYNVFNAMKLNNSNQIEHAYACGIEGGTAFCIEGTYDANPDKESIQQANLDILTPIFGSCSGTVGSNISCSGSFGADSESYGLVRVYSSSAVGSFRADAGTTVRTVNFEKPAADEMTVVFVHPATPARVPAEF